MDREPPRSSSEFEVVTPAEVKLAHDEEPAAHGRTRVNRALWPWLSLAALALLGAGLLALFAGTGLRPDTSRIAAGPDEATQPTREERRAPEEDEAEPAAADEAREDPVAPYRESLFERQREAVQDTISELVELQERLEEKAVEQWGGDALAEAQAIGDRGDEAFMNEAFEAAREHYEEALEALRALLAHSEDVYARAIERGRAALEAGASETAAEAFELARAIEADSEAAARGLARAERLDEVLALIEEAERLAGEAELEAARDKLREAIEIDGQVARSRQLLAEIESDIRDRDFNAAVSDGYAALADGALDAARAAFARALTLRRNAEEAEEGLRMVDQAATDRRIDALRAEAEALEADEAWQKAAQRYEEALELDATLSFARRGKQRSLERAELVQRIEATLDDPDRLSDDAEFERARALLSRAQRIEEPPPGLAERIEALDELLETAAIPVPVELESDGMTEVTILHVARLGTFEEHRIHLRPGVYTARGTRPGFRDVRKEFRVRPDADNPVVIRCEERI